MGSKVQPIPAGYHTLTPHVITKDCARALEFYKKAFGAIELMRHAGPQGKIMHAEIKIGNSVIMLADEFPEMGASSPDTVGGSPVTFYLYVEDCDAVCAQAISAGAIQKEPVKTEFYGDRRGGVSDPFGYTWYIATHVEDVSPEELAKRAAAQGR
ncbi:MAG: VOC family protein [Acidobacteriia bacterium]|nr:VOC family protein [Terriglobia bacterium]